MHNGGIIGFDKVCRKIRNLVHDQIYNGILGKTDSETLFALIMTNLTKPDDDLSTIHVEPRQIVAAIELAMKQVHEIQLECNVTNPESSYNIVMTDGETLVVCRFRTHPTEESPSLYYTYGTDFHYDREKDQLRLVLSEHLDDPNKAESVIIASEPLTHNHWEWKLIPNNCMLIVYRDHAEPHKRYVDRLEIHPIDYSFLDNNRQARM